MGPGLHTAQRKAWRLGLSPPLSAPIPISEEIGPGAAHQARKDAAEMRFSSRAPLWKAGEALDTRPLRSLAGRRLCGLKGGGKALCRRTSGSVHSAVLGSGLRPEKEFKLGYSEAVAS